MFKSLINWSTKNYSHLPWRVRRSYYGTLVSEIMLQQTTVNTVFGHFDRFMDQFPTIEDLAALSEEEMLMAWKGLGYYRRAKNLRKAAIDIVTNFKGDIPTTKEELVSINGIGDYTASALLSIGDDQPALAVDANLERVLARIFMLKSFKGKKLQDEIKKKFIEEELFKIKSVKSYRELNEALMDLGRMVCKANQALCDECPIKKKCGAFQHQQVLEYPKLSEKDKKSKSVKPTKLHLLRVVVVKNLKSGPKLLAYKKREKEWLGGQYELPTWVISSEDEKLSQYPVLKSKDINVKSLKSFKSTITRYSIQNSVAEMSWSEFKKHFKPKDIEHFQFEAWDFEKTNFATSVQKTLKCVGQIK